MALGQRLPEPGTPESEALLAELQAILQQQSIYSVYQPIVSLETGAVFGYEALTRGPQGSALQRPDLLFGFAENCGHLYTLDRLARERAIAGARLASRQQLLFINISSAIIYDPHFVPGQTMELLQRYGLEPHNVVFEITERSSIEDFRVAKKILEHYRKQGYRIAIDDAGAGYSSLQAIAELHPDFIKVDKSLIENIHQDKIKECILETFVTFAQKMNISLIAEGIERLDELTKLIRMGVQYAQGYLLAMPSREPAELPAELAEHIAQHRKAAAANGYWTIGDLATPIRTFDAKTLISEVASYFKEKPDAQAAVIVTDGRPVGLMMRERLFQQLAGQYGFSLFWHRTIDHIMDREPLIVDAALSVERASQLATSRSIHNLYDLVIVSREGRMAGVASIRAILETITNIRMETARVANPLTGLPGNQQINRELSKRLLEGKTFSVIYIDLDYFKWFNDRFGFHKGDQLIQFTADVVQQSIAMCGTPYDFVGHVGGDDFIVMAAGADAVPLCAEIIRRFELGVPMFYDGEEFHYVEDRHGNRIENGGVTLSLAHLACAGGASVTQEHISQASAALKKKAKALRGSVYVTSRVGAGISSYA
ncbi:bifunctional diguanylate cyclase/phosphodiesterase [Gordoniibacillus kamchatkensis]|uniref:bifunctional diguanylate cyclase/phosphodiesterase n=1 Tax=Gordoniibacillus kamchatkensis TaxID=1590651 RepID=UPI000697AE66|nr:bifunctional diguanylate cyclase/phosphodiesterase [Paenibacillus sp. VKM B-2647]